MISNPFVSQVQQFLRTEGYYRGRVDGLAGPMTKQAWNTFLSSPVGPQSPPEPNPWPADTVEALTEFYGPRASAAHQKLITLPYPMRLAWKLETVVTRTTVNRRCAESLESVLLDIRTELGLDFVAANGLDRFGGVFNDRPRKGDGVTPSTHAWACAIDLDPLRNRFKWKWPGRAAMPIEAIRIFERHHWLSGATAWGIDGMHFQAAQ